jgi:hypothetical protein
MLVERPIYSIQAARDALNVLIDFAKGREDLQPASLRAMERLEQKLEAIDLNSRRQSTLDTWLT